ncbi:hypothetical protein H6P81_003020 [Aristolochia fimbriata]|uniref:Uncharacterized protein n=1 Tax=Aristolochia fimbriata TaxID=158543 RepID=A0AAV7FBE4_ARIFI|nr:hypothetical protein H6P81_003020 [Aristolochia fimbriata]
MGSEISEERETRIPQVQTNPFSMGGLGLRTRVRDSGGYPGTLPQKKRNPPLLIFLGSPPPPRKEKEEEGLTVSESGIGIRYRGKAPMGGVRVYTLTHYTTLVDSKPKRLRRNGFDSPESGYGKSEDRFGFGGDSGVWMTTSRLHVRWARTRVRAGGRFRSTQRTQRP